MPKLFYNDRKEATLFILSNRHYFNYLKLSSFIQYKDRIITIKEWALLNPRKYLSFVTINANTLRQISFSNRLINSFESVNTLQVLNDNTKLRNILY